MIRKMIVLLLVLVAVLFAGCTESKDTKSIVDNANRLKDEYLQNVNSVNVAAERINTLGNAATKEQYIDVKNKYGDAIKAGDKATSYIYDEPSF